MYTYLASPYTHESSLVMELRFRVAERAVAEMLRESIPVYSPIVHAHSLTLTYGLPKDFEFWMTYNTKMLEPARELVILTLPGWMDSRGVKEELHLAKNFGINNRHLQPTPSETLDALKRLT